MNRIVLDELKGRSRNHIVENLMRLVGRDLVEEEAAHGVIQHLGDVAVQAQFLRERVGWRKFDSPSELPIAEASSSLVQVLLSSRKAVIDFSARSSASFQSTVRFEPQTLDWVSVP